MEAFSFILYYTRKQERMLQLTSEKRPVYNQEVITGKKSKLTIVSIDINKMTYLHWEIRHFKHIQLTVTGYNFTIFL